MVSGRDWMADELGATLEDVTYPIYHLDFETFAPAVPRFAWTRAYDAIPFQFSLHVEQRSGELQHVEYLHTSSDDPRPALAQALVDSLGKRGSICTYSSFERRVLKELASVVPELAAQILALSDRCWDLAAAIRDRYYHPEFHGKYSIKRVLPALVPGLDYGELEIGDGMSASIAYEHAIDRADDVEREHIFTALRRYCGMDTLGMVRLRRALLERALGRDT